MKNHATVKAALAPSDAHKTEAHDVPIRGMTASPTTKAPATAPSVLAAYTRPTGRPIVIPCFCCGNRSNFQSIIAPNFFVVIDNQLTVR